MRMCEQRQLHCTSQWGLYMPPSEHVHCVTIAFKMSQWVSNESASDFALSLNIPPWKLFGWWLRRLQLWATGDGQRHHTTHCACVTHCAECFGETSNHPGDSSPLQPRFGDWENCVRSQGAYFEGDWGVFVLCPMFLVSYTFFKKSLFFIVMAGYFLDSILYSYEAILFWVPKEKYYIFTKWVLFNIQI